MTINKELKKYIEENIFPNYSKNDPGHRIDHIEYVINRSLKFAKTVKDINFNMVYVVAAYHDIGHHIDAKNHEKVSAKILQEDENLKKFFTSEQIIIMKEAIEDHRASKENEPRNIYGKIVSSADRNTSIEEPLKRTYFFRIEHHHNNTIEEIIEESRQHILEKFGKKGYASEKMYFEDLEYKKFLKDITKLAEDKNKFKELYIKINNLNEK